MTPRSAARLNGGFALLEMMIAITVVVGSIVGIFSAVLRSAKDAMMAREHLIAQNAATREMERMLVAMNESTPRPDDPFEVDGLPASTGRIFSRQIRGTTPDAGVWEVTATVRWDGAYRNNRVEFRTLWTPMTAASGSP